MRFFRFLLLLYLDALVENKPIAVVPTMLLGGVMAVLVFYGVFTEPNPDPAAIGLAVVLTLMIVILVTVAIIDRRSKKKARPGPSKNGVRSRF